MIVTELDARLYNQSNPAHLTVPPLHEAIVGLPHAKRQAVPPMKVSASLDSYLLLTAVVTTIELLNTLEAVHEYVIDGASALSRAI